MVAMVSVWLLMVREQVVPPNDIHKVSHPLKWFIHLSNNLFLLITHSPSRWSIAVTGCVHSCHSHLFVNDGFQRPQICFVTASYTLAWHKRIQWLKGESRLIKVTCCCSDARNAAISAEQRRWKILLDSVLNKTSKRRPHGLKTGGVKRRLSPEGGSWPFKSQQLPRRVRCFHVCWRHSFIVTYTHN